MHSGSRTRWLRPAAQIAERAGFAEFTVMDHYFQMDALRSAEEPMLEAYTTLVYVAAVTERMRLGVLVSGVMYRYPRLLAKIVTTLDVLSGGRAIGYWRVVVRAGTGVGCARGSRQGAIRAAGGDAADLSADVERQQRALPGDALSNWRRRCACPRR
jgi:alkanesulfonate monooxygenase SsuD/methylene tetrahydromethanopterin reductase-like flavin-dependent oxidoreductase (luciferase family)